MVAGNIAVFAGYGWNGFTIELLASAQLIRSFPLGPGERSGLSAIISLRVPPILCGSVRITVDGNRIADSLASCADFRDPWLSF
jgi:hypothetical protein